VTPIRSVPKAVHRPDRRSSGAPAVPDVVGTAVPFLVGRTVLAGAAEPT
jgi:hypothetical protein